MSRSIVALLVVTNLATGYQAWVYHQRHQAAISDKTTDQEREVYGSSCLDWLTEKVKTGKYEGLELALARSWKKHGQLVFEIVPTEETSEELKAEMKRQEWDGVLCTYDKQSGTMVTYNGEERDRWMFYE
ncbi:hypothetical protein [Rhodobacter sp. SY28-1]|uniref:hypothetical protein n=1 Tax=Rhodobacter sp. SY28-1 TaxID=2562317 RepID=UPI0010BFCA88|nr:hypothetical protein [Rhodobacter sp. SY28-1]